MEEAIILDFRNAFQNKISQCESKVSITSNSSRKLPTLQQKDEKSNLNESATVGAGGRIQNCDIIFWRLSMHFYYYFFIKYYLRI